jgi:hypothetical protein
LFLHEIPLRSKIYDLEPDGDKEGVVILDHLDGMYSYCYVQGEPDKILHLYRFTPLKKKGDGFVIDHEPGNQGAGSENNQARQGA